MTSGSSQDCGRVEQSEPCQLSLCRKAAPGDVWLFPSLVASSLLFSLTAASWFSDLLWKCSGKQEQPPPGGMSPSVLVGWFGLALFTALPLGVPGPGAETCPSSDANDGFRALPQTGGSAASAAVWCLSCAPLPSLAQDSPGHSSWVWIPYLALTVLSVPAALSGCCPRCLLLFQSAVNRVLSL